MELLIFWKSCPVPIVSASLPTSHFDASHGVGGGLGPLAPVGPGGSVYPELLTCVMETKAEFSGSELTHWKLASRR